MGTSLENNFTYGLLGDGRLLKRSVFRCSSVNNVHGSTPSNRTSRGLAGNGAGGSAVGVPSTAVVHPAARTAVTSSSTVRTARR